MKGLFPAVVLPLFVPLAPPLAQAPPADGPQVRPRDPWVFRSVLDEHARIATVALSDELWVAYDVERCTLFKAWKGGVAFEGAVYDTVHGPQPRSVGATWIETSVSDGPVWSFEVNGELHPASVRYLGHRFEWNRVVFRYQLEAAGISVRIDEAPEVALEGEDIGLRREFLSGGVPDGVKVLLKFRGGVLDNTREIVTDGSVVVLADDAGAGTDLATQATNGRLRLLSNGVTTLYNWFDTSVGADVEPWQPAPSAVEADTGGRGEPGGVVLHIPQAIAVPVVDGQVDELWSAVPAVPVTRLVAGERASAADLVAQAQLCYDAEHLYVLFSVEDDAVVNDSGSVWDDDAVEIYLDGGHERGDWFDENDAQYLFGFGDTEFGVTNDPALHPGVEFATTRTPEGYRVEVRLPWANLGVVPRPELELGLELHVDDDDDGEGADTALAWYSRSSNAWADTSVFATVALAGAGETRAPRETGPRERGLALRRWDVALPPAELPRLVPGQTPNRSTVVPRVEFTSAGDVGDPPGPFLAELSGYLQVAGSGVHQFRLTSDEGARLWLDHFPVVEDTEGHSARSREGRMDLAAGLHPLRLEWFQGGGALALHLEWKPPGAEAWSTIPEDALSTPAGEVRVTAPGAKRVIAARERPTPGDRYPLAGVHPAYDLVDLCPDGFEPRVGGLAFQPDGRLLVSTWDATGDVWELSGVVPGERGRVRAQRIASGLAEPLGLAVVGDEIYVLQKQELTRLVDRDGDGRIDEYTCLADGWGVTPNFHEFAFGLVWDEGDFWATLAIAIDPGGRSTQPQDPDRGSVIRIGMDGSHEIVARGLRTPNGIAPGPNGRLLVTDNQGDWLPSSKLVELREGAFYGNRSVDPTLPPDLEETAPLVWLPQGEIGNSPGQPLTLPDEGHGPYGGQVLLTDVTHGGLKRVFVEEVDDARQGCVFRFSQGLQAGTNRAIVGPDGALYVGGIGSAGNWSQPGKRKYGLERLAYADRAVFELLAVRARSNGFELEFTAPLVEGAGVDAADYVAKAWRYGPTADYGGPKLDERDIVVRTATVSEDRRRVFLELDEMPAGHVVYLRLVGPFAGELGGGEVAEPWTREAWYTLNRVPGEVGISEAALPLAPENTLTEAEQAEGFRLLFDGESLDAWRAYGGADAPGGWRAVDGTLAFVPGEGEGGDLISRDRWRDFELRLEWKISEGGNSGIFYRVSEEHSYPWETGPEMQVLDDARHPDGRNPKTSAGANYALDAPRVAAVRPAGAWNSVRLVVRGDRVEHWLNGLLVVEYTLWDAAWKARVAASKFSAMPAYGLESEGHLVLQDHGDRVWYRNIRVREL